MKPDRNRRGAKDEDRVPGRAEALSSSSLVGFSTTLRSPDRDARAQLISRDRYRTRGLASANTPAWLVIYTRWDDGRKIYFFPPCETRDISKEKDKVDKYMERICWSI